MIFVAYDLGSLVVNHALSIASGFDNEYSSIFWNTSRVVRCPSISSVRLQHTLTKSLQIFAGCPQRRMNTPSMMSKIGSLLSLLPGELDLTSRYLLPQVVENLAVAAMQTTEAFTATKIAFRAHIVHLYAGEGDGGMIDAVGAILSYFVIHLCLSLTCAKSMDGFTATIGLPSEITIQEQNSQSPRFPLLCKIVGQGLAGVIPTCIFWGPGTSMC